MPFAALVDDLVLRAEQMSSGSGGGYQLTCQEWTHAGSIQTLPQLVIVSADRAVQGEFLHFAQGLQLHKQLAYLFFDECHVALTDTSYRVRLQRLWELRYLSCPFVCLTATLLVSLESKLRERLLIPQAHIFRRSTARGTIRYSVREVGEEDSLLNAAVELVQTLPLPFGKRGIIYVRSYNAGEELQEILEYPFYNAKSDEKAVVLKEWVNGGGSGGWIIATGALGTGVNIANIIYIIHIGRPYGLTSFIQQSGRGGRSGEVSESYVILHSSGGGKGKFDVPRVELKNTYSVEVQDEVALSKYLQSTKCRRVPLAKYLDGDLDDTDCLATQSILCDRCQEATSRSGGGSQGRRDGSGSPLISGVDAISHALQVEVLENEQLEQFHQVLCGHCIYCQLMRVEGEEYSHQHQDCPYASKERCKVEAYRQWRSQLQLAVRDQCFRCGLSQRVCKAVEEQRGCTYPHLMLPGLFFLQQAGQLQEICVEAGFGGEEEWQWKWLSQQGEGSFGQLEVNWMRVWRRVGQIYSKLPKELSVE